MMFRVLDSNGNSTEEEIAIASSINNGLNNDSSPNPNYEGTMNFQLTGFTVLFGTLVLVLLAIRLGRRRSVATKEVSHFHNEVTIPTKSSTVNIHNDELLKKENLGSTAQDPGISSLSTSSRETFNTESTCTYHADTAVPTLASNVNAFEIDTNLMQSKNSRPSNSHLNTQASLLETEGMVSMSSSPVSMEYLKRVTDMECASGGQQSSSNYQNLRPSFNSGEKGSSNKTIIEMKDCCDFLTTDGLCTPAFDGSKDHCQTVLENSDILQYDERVY